MPSGGGRFFPRRPGPIQRRSLGFNARVRCQSSIFLFLRGAYSSNSQSSCLLPRDLGDQGRHVVGSQQHSGDKFQSQICTFLLSLGRNLLSLRRNPVPVAGNLEQFFDKFAVKAARCPGCQKAQRDIPPSLLPAAQVRESLRHRSARGVKWLRRCAGTPSRLGNFWDALPAGSVSESPDSVAGLFIIPSFPPT